MSGITITYLNVLDGKRHVLLDELTEEQATRILSGPFADPTDRNSYLPGLRIEA